METAALNAVAGRPKEEYGLEPQSLEEVRPGCYDVHERVKDMDAGGVLASMNFPSFPTFTARTFFRADDVDLSNALVRAYNDWHIDEWCGAYPGRFIPMAVPAIWDPVETAAEVRRCAAKGCHSLSFTENPAALGYPSFHDDYWDPVWQACVDTGTVLSIHLGSSGRLAIPAVDSPPDVMITLQPMNIQSAAADLLWSRVIKTYPALRIALSEGGTGWVPYFLVPRRPHLRDAPRRGRSRTSVAVFPARCSASTSSPASSATRWACSSASRSASTTSAGRPTTRTATRCGPTRPRSCGAVFAANDVPADHVAKMTHENAMRWYSFDPFTSMPKAESTVGALRAKAAGHDVSTMSRSTRVRTPAEKLEGLPQAGRARCRRRALTWTTSKRSGS